ncbi:MAG TPA: hypothetical protein VFB54_20265 [Burkholderiales bacterium]|nr:hypothetical protein [Burkholderiales bacterium]
MPAPLKKCGRLFMATRSILLATVLASVASATMASKVTLKFDGESIYNYYRGSEKGFGWQNVVQPGEGGYVQGHWDLSDRCSDSGLCGPNPDPDAPPYDYDFSSFLGTDPTGCRKVDPFGIPLGPVTDVGAPLNPQDHVGAPCGTPLKLDRAGLPFDVISFIPTASGAISSSKGGYAKGNPGYLTLLEGDVWSGVDWIIIHGCSCGSPAGIDDLTLQISEPKTVALLASFVLVSVLLRGRRRA